MKKFLTIFILSIILIGISGCVDNRTVSTSAVPSENVTYVKEYHDSDSDDTFWNYMLWSNVLGSSRSEVHHYYHTPVTHVTNTKIVNKYASSGVKPSKSSSSSFKSTYKSTYKTRSSTPFHSYRSRGHY